MKEIKNIKIMRSTEEKALMYTMIGFGILTVGVIFKMVWMIHIY